MYTGVRRPGAQGCDYRRFAGNQRSYTGPGQTADTSRRGRRCDRALYVSSCHDAEARGDRFKQRLVGERTASIAADIER